MKHGCTADPTMPGTVDESTGPVITASSAPVESHHPPSKLVAEAFENGRKAALIAAVEECQAYSKSTTSEEAKAVAMNLAVRITQRAKKGT
jgi:hypothetical protein